MISISACETRAFCCGCSVVVAAHAISQSSPSSMIATKAQRQPNCTAMKPTTGPASAPPSGVPELITPIALATSLRGNQLLTILLLDELNGPSPMPKSTRKTMSEPMPVASAVAPQNTDHTPIAVPNTRFAPTLSDSTPPTKLNNA